MAKTNPKTMKLGVFIAQTLTEIIDGVSMAQEYAKKKGALINPGHISWSDEKHGFYANAEAVGYAQPDEEPLMSPIDFEVLLTIGEDDKAQAGVGIFAAALGLGAKAEGEDYTESVNKIKFQILAQFPHQPPPPEK